MADNQVQNNHKNCNWRNEYQLFSKIYRGRQDCVAMMKDGSYSMITGGFTYERFKEHVELTNKYALYLMDDSGKVSFCLFDLDVLPRNQEWPVLVEKIAVEKEKTKQVIDTLSKFGITDENILIEFPTVGYHLILSFLNPISASIVKKFMQMVLEESACSGTPFYPRTVKKGTLGDRVQLPFRINNNTHRRSNLVRDLDSFNPEAFDQTPDFFPLENIKPVDDGLIIKLVENS